MSDPNGGIFASIISTVLTPIYWLKNKISPDPLQKYENLMKKDTEQVIKDTKK